MKYAAAIIAALAAVYFLSTAPALWYLSDTDKATLIAKVEKEQGHEAALYIRKAMRF
jgi:hypothetical protein